MGDGFGALASGRETFQKVDPPKELVAMGWRANLEG
jgi:hypothetical protein